MAVIDKYLVNERITYKQVRLIDKDGGQLGVMTIDQARKVADEKGLDLILIAEKGDPPVCKIEDFGHFKYELAKKRKDSKKAGRRKGSTIKELKLSIKIGIHDFNVRLRAAEKFLKKGYKVKVTLMFKGREATHPEVGEKLIRRFCESLQMFSKVEGAIDNSNTRAMIAMLMPSKHKIERNSNAKIEN